MSGLTLEVITPRGGFMHEDGAQRVVVRRRERLFDPGSEVAILPGHAPMLVRLADHTLRFVEAGGRARRLDVHGGFAEVIGDVVTVITPRAERPAPEGTGRTLRVVR